MCTFLTLQRCVALLCQTQLEGVSREEKEALRAEVWALTSSSLPLIVRRMDDGTMLPGRCTALEYAFFKKSLMLKSSALREPPLSARQLHLVGLCFGYASGLAAANALLDFVRTRHEADAEAFVLRVLDCMLLASRSLSGVSFFEEQFFACNVQRHVASTHHLVNVAFIASLRIKWTAAATVRMRRERGLLDTTEAIVQMVEKRQQTGARTLRGMA